MTSAFYLLGGATDTIRQQVGLTTPIVIAGSANAMTGIVQFQCNEVAGATPLLTVEIYNADTLLSYYLGANGVTYKAKALTAGQSVLFDTGWTLSPNEFLRVTVNAANQVHVVGLSLLNNALMG